MPNWVEIRRRAAHPTTAWSGGTTTELYIDPPDSVYQERNFAWRLSTATVAAQESIFTELPGVTRTLLMLQGTVELEHQGHYQKTLHPFEQDTFQGDWRTICHGKAIDFNLMTRAGFHGKLTPVSLNFDTTYTVPASLLNGAKPLYAYAVYVWNGKVNLVVDGESARLEQGDLGCVKIMPGCEPGGVLLGNSERTATDLIVSTIFTGGDEIATFNLDY